MCDLTNESYKTYQTEFSLCRLGHAPGVGLGVLGVKNLSVGICDGATSTARSSYILHTRLNMHSESVHMKYPYPLEPPD